MRPGMIGFDDGQRRSGLCLFFGGYLTPLASVGERVMSNAEVYPHFMIQILTRIASDCRPHKCEQNMMGVFIVALSYKSCPQVLKL